MNKEHMTRFYEAYWFIDGHPAFIGGLFHGINTLDVQVSKCCKRGFTKMDIHYVYRTDERFEEFWDKGYQQSVEEGMPELDCVWVPYKVFYGEEWSFDHVEIWLEGGSHFYVKGGHYGAEWNFNRFHDVDLDVGGRTYEEAIINFAEKVKEKYGDYSSSEFDDNTIYPKWIVENNRENPAFGDDIRKWFKNGTLSRNPKNIHLEPHEVNSLWWHLHGSDQDFGNAETFDITKYLTRENYESGN